jgi:hypothetical protein
VVAVTADKVPMFVGGLIVGVVAGGVGGWYSHMLSLAYAESRRAFHNATRSVGKTAAFGFGVAGAFVLIIVVGLHALGVF